MTKRVIAAIVVYMTLASLPVGAQAPADPASKNATPAADEKAGQPGNLDPGVTFINVVENAQVRVLQITLQAGAVPVTSAWSLGQLGCIMCHCSGAALYQ